MKIRFAIVGAFIFLTPASPSLAQEVVDTSFRKSAIHNLIQYYYTAIGQQAHLYNGPLYENYERPFTQGHQYFQTDSFTTGTVSYDGLEYFGIPLKYDIIRDELIILHHNGTYPINLIKGKVDSFSFSGHSFIKIDIDSSTNFPGSGFYAQLYSSPEFKLLANRRKLIQEINTRATMENKVYERNSYYVLKGHVYHRIKNKNSIIDLLRLKKNEIQQYIKKNNLRFTKSFETDVIHTVRYYDELMKTR